ncbi:MAG TPA: hypothetical protein VMR21_08960 [Vicinamibacteria bacterium]|nr:hypothetical protein [Vicinamibacteria bacterium]
MRRRDLLRVARRVAGILGSDGVLVGGLAVGAHGYLRATGDVDFVTRLPLKEAQTRLQAGGVPTTLQRGDPLEGGFSCLRGVLEDVRIDVMPLLVPLDWERSIEMAWTRGPRLRVVDLDGLLRLKFRAGGPKDLMDAAALALRHPDHRDKGRELAMAYGVGETFETWLGDRRLRAEIERERAGEGSTESAPRRARTPRRGQGSRPPGGRLKPAPRARGGR